MFTTTSGYLRLIAVFLLLAASAFAFQDPPDDVQPRYKTQGPLAQQLDQFPGLLNALDHLGEKLSLEVKFPPLRSKSRLLPVVPAAGVFYLSGPNHGGGLQQAHQILRQELESNEDFREWWQNKAMSGSPGEFDEAMRGAIQVSEYIGDEIVVTTMFHQGHDSTILIAEVRKPGLAAVLQQLNKKYSGKSGSSIRILTPEQLASPGAAPKDATLVLVRPDFVVVAQKLADLKSFNARLNARAGDQLANTPFGQRIEQSYQSGVGVLAAVDVGTLTAQSPDARRSLSALKQTGFDDLKYVVAERKEIGGDPRSSIDLSFAGPRHGAASWLGAPAPAGGMDFIAPDATIALDLRLKDLSQVLDDVQSLVDPANRSFATSLETMQKQFNINLRDDLLSQLTGEVALAVDPPSGAGNTTPEVRAILSVRDADGLQQTLIQGFTLLGGMTPDANEAAVQQSTEGGVTYYSVRSPGQPKGNRLHYAFVDSYLVLGTRRSTLRDAIRVHQNGRSLARSADFQTALPREDNGSVSAVLFEDFGRLFDFAAGQAPPAQVQVMKIMMGQGKRNIGWALAGESSIRLVSSGSGSDIYTISIPASIGLPHLLGSLTAATESARPQTVRLFPTYQITYATTYPDKGFARSLAVLRGGALCPNAPWPGTACRLEGPLGKAICTAGAGCEPTDYRFSVSAECGSAAPCTESVVIAAPATAKSGDRSYCATSDGVPRRRSGPPLSKPISADECLKWNPL